jgi:hypothetical protein
VFRTLCIGAALLAAVGLAVPSLSAAPGKQELISRTLKRISPRVITGGVSTASSTRKARSRLTTVVLFTDSASLVDADGDDDVGTGDMVIASGRVFNLNGRRVGFWDGTFSHTSDDSSMINLTLVFPDQGTVTIAGAPYADGSPYFDRRRARFPAAPVVGSSGSVRFRGLAGFGVDQDDNLALILSR